MQIGWISLDSFRAGLDIDAKAAIPPADRQRGYDRLGRGDSGWGQARLQAAPCTATMQDQDKATRLEGRQAGGGPGWYGSNKRRVTCAREPTTKMRKRGQGGLAVA